MSAMPDYRVWAEVDLDALANNLRWIRFGIGEERGIITVVKADAYGHGLQQIAGHLMQHGTDILGVANLGEAAAVRSIGKGWPILMLGACYSSGEFKQLCLDGVAATISSESEASELARIAQKLDCQASVHLKIDTGMGRLGVSPEGALSLARLINGHASLALDGVYTHLSSSEDDEVLTRIQLNRFEGFLGELTQNRLSVSHVHAMNSGGLAYEERWVGNFVRPGLLVYGIVPRGRRRGKVEWLKRLRPVLSLKSKVAFVKKMSTGSPISYGQKDVCSRTSVLATVCAGYGDGILRSGGRRMEVMISGKRCPVRGMITMDQMIVDVSEVPNVRRGDEVVIIGTQGGDGISAKDQARAAGTIPWEVLTSITQRVPRIYRGVSV